MASFADLRARACLLTRTRTPTTTGAQGAAHVAPLVPPTMTMYSPACPWRKTKRRSKTPRSASSLGARQWQALNSRDTSRSTRRRRARWSAARAGSGATSFWTSSAARCGIFPTRGRRPCVARLTCLRSLSPTWQKARSLGKRTLAPNVWSRCRRKTSTQLWAAATAESFCEPKVPSRSANGSPGSARWAWTSIRPQRAWAVPVKSRPRVRSVAPRASQGTRINARRTLRRTRSRVAGRCPPTWEPRSAKNSCTEVTPSRSTAARA
mmetsp:Transcript_6385/g.25790  ORF Transcript_6385/g.25790 Transcript_6385/m.25790 type:complete len:266 (+) Transcript_6385:1027-1824(+)